MEVYLYLVYSCRSGVLHSELYEGQMRMYKVTQGPHCDDDETMAVPEPC